MLDRPDSDQLKTRLSVVSRLCQRKKKKERRQDNLVDFKVPTDWNHRSEIKFESIDFYISQSLMKWLKRETKGNKCDNIMIDTIL